MPYFVYTLECSDKTYYNGFTSDLEKRLIKHNLGLYMGSYTSTRLPVVLKWYVEFTNYTSGKDFERQIKGWRREKIEALINEEWDRLPQLSKAYWTKTKKE